MKRLGISLLVASVGGFVAATALLAADVVNAQAVYTGPSQTFDGPMTVNGFVTMTNGLSVDGGVRTTEIQADRAAVGGLDAGSVTAGSLEVTGATNFRTRPNGIFLPGTLTRPGGLSLGIGCSTLGVISVPGALVKDSCDVATLPTAALNLGVVFDCFVTAANTVTVRSCGLVALVAAPAGDYNVVVSGPVP